MCRPTIATSRRRSGELVTEPGPVEVIAGSSSDDNRSTGMLTVTGARRTVDGEERAYLSETTIS